jgi:hypothetical protein
MPKKEQRGLTDEASEQKKLVAWARDEKTLLEFPELRWLYSNPNQSSNRSNTAWARRQGSIKNAMGRVKGVPDLFLPVPRRDRCGLFIEMKTPTGELSKDQEEFIRFAVNQGYTCIVPTSGDEAIMLVTNYMEEV